MKLIGMFAATVILASLGSAARAQSNDAYQLAVIPGSSQVTEVVVRVDVATGAAAMSIGQQAMTAITEPTPVGRGAYHVYSWSTIDNGTATRAFNVYRLDAQSGRVWHLAYDGKTPPSWAEISAAH